MAASTAAYSCSDDSRGRFSFEILAKIIDSKIRADISNPLSTQLYSWTGWVFQCRLRLW